jgi:phage tail sheath protein FI
MMFTILDPLPNQTAVNIKDYRENLTASIYQEFGALYWPRIKIANPSRNIFGATDSIIVCPSGYIAGVIARVDKTASEGPFAQPAGVDNGKPSGVVGLEMEEVKLEPKRDLIFPKRINPISYLRNYGYFVDGARCLDGSRNFPHVGSRRGVSHVEKLLNDGLQWTRHKNNTPALREEVESAVFAELRSWMNRGAFASQDPNTAFFVDVSDALNPPSVVLSGQLIIRVGMATNTPAEFVIIKITKDTRALTEEWLGQ